MAFSGLYLTEKISLFVLFMGIFFLYKIISTKTFPLPEKNILLFLFGIFLSSFIHIGEVEWISVLFTYFFIYTYFILVKDINPQLFVSAIKFIFWAYLVYLVLGQIYVALGLFVPKNINDFGLQFGSFGSVYQLTGETFRQRSLSTEPSHAAFFTVISMISILKCDQLFGLRTSKKYWLAYLYMMVGYTSSFGLLVLPVPLLIILKKNNFKLGVIILGLLLGIAIFILFSSQFFFQRLFIFFEMISSELDLNNLENIQGTDGSAFYRIGPTFVYFNNFKILDIYFWIGHGINKGNEFISNIIYSNSDYELSIHFFPGFFYDYGLILGVLFLLIFLKKLRLSKNLSYTFIFIFLMLNSSINTQLFWFFIISFTLVEKFKNFYKQG